MDAVKVLTSLKDKASDVKWSDRKRKEHFVIFARTFKKKIDEDDLVLYDLNDLAIELYGDTDAVG